ncbi:hypothetical protein [Paraburkholderia ginsengiterrae]|nr:hypothetical protein [Paraburkholderia ginsengiterrae]
MERVLTDYFDYDNLATVVRVLRRAGTELQSRIDQVADLVRRLEEQHTHAR